ASRFADARPLQPILDLLRAWLQAPGGRPLGNTAKERLARLIPQASARALILALDSDGTQRIVPEHLTRWLSALGRERRLIVFLDDADLAGGGSLDLLEQVARGLANSRMLLILGRQTARRAQNERALRRLEERLIRIGRSHTIDLRPYDISAITRLVESTFAADAPVRSVARALLERSGGLPSELTELTAALETCGAIAAGPAGWTLLTAPENWPRSDSAAHLLEARFAALPLQQRLWLQRFAVAGQRLEPSFLAKAFGHTTAQEVGRWLEDFTRAGWLERNGPRYHFARGSLRAAVWRCTRKERRARLHQRMATALESQGLGQQEPLERAFHLRNAGAYAALLEHLEPHLPSLATDQPPRHVLTLTLWGLEALGEVGPDTELEAELLTRGADAAKNLGRRTQQRQLLERLTELDLNDKQAPDLVARVYLQHGRFAAERGSFGLARGLLRNARIIAERADNPDLVHATRLARGEVNLECGAHQEACEDFYSILSADPKPPPTLLARARLAMGLVDLLDDHFELALDAAKKAQRDLGEDTRPTAQGLRVRALLLRSRADRILGRSEHAWKSLNEAQRLATRAGERALEIEIGSRRGRLLLEHGHEHDAELELREASWQAREMDDARGRTTAELFLGILLAERGDPEGGLMLERVRYDLGQQGLTRLQALAEALTARAALQAGQIEQAQARADLALKQLELYGAELQDRIVIEGTAGLVAQAQGLSSQRRIHQKNALARIQREVDQVRDPQLASSLRRAAATYVRAAFTLEGPVYPRRSAELLRPRAY
ncbi:MAG: tetratricopeptide (TPR) repeat protein, partial [Planctomycetota bacterium]